MTTLPSTTTTASVMTSSPMVTIYWLCGVYLVLFIVTGVVEWLDRTREGRLPPPDRSVKRNGQISEELYRNSFKNMRQG